jgi:cytochrome c peroxidase
VKAPRAAQLVAAAVAIAFGVARGHEASSAGQDNPSLPPQAQKEIAQVEAEIDRIETQTLTRLAAPPGNQVQQTELLGKR